MGPTPREWLGAGLLALAVTALIVLLVMTAMPGGAEAGAATRALLGA
jgi:hypothetical protein